jgi:tetratricopeptide (TPR) repeat protein
MKVWEKGPAFALVALAVAQAPPAFAQDKKDLADIDAAMAQAQGAMSKIDLSGLDWLDRDMARAQAELMKLDTLNIRIPSVDLSGMSERLAMMKSQTFPLFQQAKGARQFYFNSGGEYDSGTRLLDEHKYDEAIQRFDRVIATKSDRTDGALYWRAYALNRIGRRDEAIAALAVLRRDYPNSRWLNDAQALEVEVKQNAGRPVSPADESNEDIKLMAINSLMNADPERAIPLLEGLLKSNATPRVKDRAMFVLTQNRSARAQQILADYAKGAGNPDLQVRAIRYIGMSGTPEAQQQLASVYAASNDVAVKREIIRSLMVSRGRDVLFNLAKSEKDPSLRAEAIRQLGVMKATDQLAQLYASESSADNKIEIIRALMVAGASDKLLDLAKNEKDPAVRGEAIRNLAVTHSTTPETLTSLYTSDMDVKTKHQLIDALHSRGDAKSMVDLARKESDPAMKKFIVERLSNMRGSKEATDYMMELLK